MNRLCAQLSVILVFIFLIGPQLGIYTPKLASDRRINVLPLESIQYPWYIMHNTPMTVKYHKSDVELKKKPPHI